MTVGMQFMSNRMCIILGSVLLTASNIITAYATDIRLLFVSIGFLEGKHMAFFVFPVARKFSGIRHPKV